MKVWRWVFIEVHIDDDTQEPAYFRHHRLQYVNMLSFGAEHVLARNGVGGKWHFAYHEFMQIHLQARVIYVNAYHVP